MTARDAVSSMALWEAVTLARLVEELRELLGAERDIADPAVARLTPSPYPDDDEAAREFASTTRDELLDRRVLDADTVSLVLTRMQLDADLNTDTDTETDTDPLETRTIRIAESDVDAWLRTITAIRLVIAERLGITMDDQHDAEDDRFAVYDWLGYRLELLIHAADDPDG